MKRWAEGVIEKVKQYQIYTKQAVNQRYYMKSDFVGSVGSGGDDMTVQEMCRGKMQDLAYMDLTKISTLEDKVSNLYRQLVKLHASMESTLEPNVVNFANTTKLKSMKHAREAMKMIDSMGNDLVDISMIVPSKINYSSKPQDHSDEVDFDAENHVKYELSLTTNEVLARLPSFARNRTECEKGIRALVRAFHVQKNIWNIEKEALTEEMNFYKRSHEFQMQYSQSMIKEVEQAIQSFMKNANVATGGSESDEQHASPSDVALGEILDSFATFDANANEVNLRNLLRVLRDCSKNLPTRSAPLSSRSSTASKGGNSLNLRLSQDYQKFLREIAIIQSEYQMKEENLIGKKYRLEEEMLKSPMFMQNDPMHSASTNVHRASISKRTAVK